MAEWRLGESSVRARHCESGRAAAEWMAARPLIGYDTETNGLNTRGAAFQCRLVQVSDGDEALLLTSAVAHKALMRLMFDGHRPALLMWNAHFDVSVTHAATGILLYDHFEVWDVSAVMRVMEPRTLIARDKRFPKWLIQSGKLEDAAARRGMLEPKYADEDICQLAADRKWIKRPNSQDKGPMYAQCDWHEPAFERYAALDPAVVVRMWHAYRADMDWYDRRGIALDREVGIELSRCSLRGMEIDMERYRPERQALDDRIEKAEEQLHAMDSWHTAARIKRTMERLGVESPRKTPKGAESWDAVAIQMMRGDDSIPREAIQLLDVVQEHRRATKWRSTYILPMEDGIVHPSYIVPGTLTGRVAAHSPPIQQQPKKARVRSLYRSRDGYVLVGADYSQLELRLMALLAHAGSIGQALLSGMDMHHNLALSVWGEGYDEILRDTGKRGMFAWAYGVGESKMGATLDISDQDAARLLNGLQETYPEIVHVRARLGRQRQIVTMGGRRIRLLDRWRDETGTKLWPSSHKAFNYGIQGAGADMLSTATIHWRNMDAPGDLWLSLHDELVVEVAEDQAAEAAEALEQAMSVTLGGFPFPAEATILGTHWEEHV